MMIMLKKLRIFVVIIQIGLRKEKKETQKNNF